MEALKREDTAMLMGDSDGQASPLEVRPGFRCEIVQLQARADALVSKGAQGLVGACSRRDDLKGGAQLPYSCFLQF